jgi:hypothetical protein
VKKGGAKKGEGRGGKRWCIEEWGRRHGKRRGRGEGEGRGKMECGRREGKRGEEGSGKKGGRGGVKGKGKGGGKRWKGGLLGGGGGDWRKRVVERNTEYRSGRYGHSGLNMELIMRGLTDSYFIDL